MFLILVQRKKKKTYSSDGRGFRTSRPDIPLPPLVKLHSNTRVQHLRRILATIGITPWRQPVAIIWRELFIPIPQHYHVPDWRIFSCLFTHSLRDLVQKGWGSGECSANWRVFSEWFSLYWCSLFLICDPISVNCSRLKDYCCRINHATVAHG